MTIQESCVRMIFILMQALMACRFGEKMGTDRRGDKQKQGNQYFVQTDPFLMKSKINRRSNGQASNPQSGCLSGAMQTSEKIPQPEQTDRAGECEKGSENQKERDQNLYHHHVILLNLFD